MKFLDLFAGIGGFRLGMEAAGHECVGYVEWDKFARKSYEAIHNIEGEWTAHDITTVTNNDLRSLRGKVDIICGGFPCQAFSIAGKRLGFAETRGTLFFEIARFAKEIQPQYLFLENVKGLLNHDSGNTFRTIISTLDELGYDAEWQLLNSKDYGVPQNRERVFIIGHLRGRSGREVFPIRRSYETAGVQRVGNINPSGNGMNGNVYSFDGLAPTLTTNKGEGPKVVVKGMLDIKGKDQIRRVYGTEGISPCLTTMQGGGQEPKIIQPVLTPDRAEKRQNGRRIKEPGEPMFTLTAQDRHGVLIREATKKGYAEANIGDSINFSVPNSKTRRGRVGKGVAQTLDTSCNQATIENKPPYRIRKLTPRECWRLQGFPDWAFDKAEEVNSNSQLYKQAGNSVTVNVIHAIAERLV
ncbi:DNA cytosine methyltransferase [Bacillus sp. AFS075034]|uniref:DNA cytosine methyltransferase n=1 Tax=Bacillus sp. AFS075034 TaxID=2034281 RepID=UPI000BF51D8D|nr:DNA cytosine methyltransferase [Bacillus sp. AFS075034]PFW65302.1 DNA (cytosine-5-)-methyltransferase [Bacillus sp. AFS075034]